jgi:predicted nucleic acid-binding protein
MIVLDSSTIILLAKIELLDIFIDGYEGDIIIAKEVEKESTIKSTFDSLLIKKRIEERKIQVKNVQDNRVGKLMNDFNINAGEAESIMLALKVKARIMGTDDKNAINACRLLKIPFTTAIDVLIRAGEKNLITKEESYSKLTQLSRFGRYRKEILEDAKRRLR